MTRHDVPILCLSHLRWNFVYQRPQHLLARCACARPVIYVEEPRRDAPAPHLELEPTPCGVIVAIPHLPPGMSPALADAAQRAMIDRLLARELGGQRPVLWYYTPMAIPFTQHVKARAIVYDCMDELSLFDGAPPELAARERVLLAHADVVFTGGHSLYEHKRATSRHCNIHAFPSSVDVDHFMQARYDVPDPEDQAEIPRPRVGFYGVIDERMDLALIDGLAAARPDLALVMIGPIVKIDPATLPRRPDLYWIGPRSYEQLPAYLAGWDVALLPFARNASTRFISPTKTPEYLAAGRPVVSTSIADVVTPYGRDGLVWIADTPDEVSAAIDEARASDARVRTTRCGRGWVRSASPTPSSTGSSITRAGPTWSAATTTSPASASSTTGSSRGPRAPTAATAAIATRST